MNYYKILALKRPCLRVITIALNYACQFSCRHCSAHNLNDTNGSVDALTNEQISTVLRDAQQCGALNMHFTGGEPLLDKRLYDIIPLIDVKRNIISFATNGLLLAEQSRKLKTAGVDLAIVSINSPQADVHDTLCGYPGAHKRAWEGIDAALKAGLKVMIAMMANSENIHNGDIEKQIEICKKRRLPLQLLPARSFEMGGKDPAMLLLKEDKEKFYGYMHHPNVRWDGMSSYLGCNCLAARQRVYVTPEGDVFPCDFVQRSFGNIKAQSLERIWKRMLETVPFNQINSDCLSAFGSLDSRD